MLVRNPNMTKFKTNTELAESLGEHDVILLDLHFDEEEVGDLDQIEEVAKTIRKEELL